MGAVVLIFFALLTSFIGTTNAEKGCGGFSIVLALSGTILLCVSFWYQRKLHLAHSNDMAIRGAQAEHQAAVRQAVRHNLDEQHSRGEPGHVEINTFLTDEAMRADLRRQSRRSRRSRRRRHRGVRRLIQEKLEPSGLPTTLGAVLLACFLLYLFFKSPSRSRKSMHKVYIVKKAPTFVET